MAVQRTFSILKPDATRRNLTGAVNAVIEKAGLRIVGADYVRTYFGTYGGWAGAGTGGLLQRFNAGVHSVGAIAQATYHWTEKFQTTAYVEYKHLVGDAAKSPIVKTYGSRDSITLGISASYAFDLGF